MVDCIFALHVRDVTRAHLIKDLPGWWQTLKKIFPLGTWMSQGETTQLKLARLPTNIWPLLKHIFSHALLAKLDDECLQIRCQQNLSFSNFQLVFSSLIHLSLQAQFSLSFAEAITLIRKISFRIVIKSPELVLT